MSQAVAINSPETIRQGLLQFDILVPHILEPFWGCLMPELNWNF